MYKQDILRVRIGALVAVTLFAPLCLAKRPASSIAGFSQVGGPAGALQLTGLQILDRGQAVDFLITGTKAKRYSLNLIGSGFDAGTVVLINGRKVPTTFVSSTQLSVRLKGSLVPAAGELQVIAANSDGSLSNTLPLDVVSNPAVLSLSSVSPNFGQVGAQVTLNGTGFTPAGNRLRVRIAAEPHVEGETVELPSPDGRTITFNVPAQVCSPCASIPCLTPCFAVAPGDFLIAVVNSNGVSNNLPFLVSGPTDPLLSSISPSVGQVGAQITIKGTGFTPAGNRLRLRRAAQPTLAGETTEFPSPDGRTITVNLPSTFCPPCVYSNPGCLLPCLAIVPGDYLIAVVNANGTSNDLPFLVSSAGGPIGVWGAPGIRVEVSDYQVRVSGLCFTGVAQQALELDASGHFAVAGEYFPLIGPIGGPGSGRPADFSGSISNGVMTLTISVKSGSPPTTIGPFSLAFGDDVVVVHPCV